MVLAVLVVFMVLGVLGSQNFLFCTLSMFATLITIVRPYRTINHVVDVVLNLSVALCYFSAVTSQLSLTDYPFLYRVNVGIMSVSGSVPLLYMNMLILHWVLLKWKSLQQWWTLLKFLLLKGQFR